MASKMDATYPIINLKSNLTKKQKDIITKASNNCWWIEKYLRMSLFENRLAGKKMRKHERA